MGYSIHTTMGLDGGYRFDAGTELPPLLFDDEQAIALAVALQVATLAGVGIEEAAVRALTTVRQVMPSRLRHSLDGVEFTTIPTRPGDGAPDSGSPGVPVALSAAVRAHEVLRIDYASRRPNADTEMARQGRAAPSRDIHGSWYLVAWDLERDDWRIFRADRIMSRSPTGPRFVPRGGFPVVT